MLLILVLKRHALRLPHDINWELSTLRELMNQPQFGTTLRKIRIIG
jgi:hypothetical protein